MSKLIAIVFVLQLLPTNHLPVVPENPPLCEDCFILILLQSKSKNIHFISRSNVEMCFHNLPEIVWTNYNRVEEIVLKTEWEDLCLISAEDPETLLDLLGSFRKCQKTKVILVLTKPDLVDLKTVFKRCWQLGITDVVVTDNFGSCRVFTYFPFGENSCYNFSPVLINSSDRQHMNSTMNYFEDKLSNLHTCELQIISSKISNENVQSRGLVPYLMKALNARPRIFNEYRRGTPVNAEIGIAMHFKAFYPTAERLGDYVLSPVTVPVHVGLLLPHRQVPFVGWSRIYKEFSLCVWLGTSACVAVVVLYWYLRESDLSFVFFVTLQTLISTPIPPGKLLRWQDRLCFLLWLTFSLILNSAYNSSLRSKLSVPIFNDAIKNIDDFTKSDIPIVMPAGSGSKTNLDIFFKYGAIRDKVVVVQNATYRDLVMGSNGSVAYIGSVKDIEYFSDGTYHFLPDFIHENFWSYFVLPKPSPFERVFRRGLLRIFNAGAFAEINGNMHDFDLSLRERKRSKEDQRTFGFSLKDMAAVFMMLMVGYFLATAAFVAECLSLKMASFLAPKNDDFSLTNLCAGNA